eukprot:318447-Chlamydomonas_euryale.AAC.4
MPSHATPCHATLQLCHAPVVPVQLCQALLPLTLPSCPCSQVQLVVWLAANAWQVADGVALDPGHDALQQQRAGQAACLRDAIQRAGDKEHLPVHFAQRLEQAGPFQRQLFFPQRLELPNEPPRLKRLFVVRVVRLQPRAVAMKDEGVHVEEEKPEPDVKAAPHERARARRLVVLPAAALLLLVRLRPRLGVGIFVVPRGRRRRRRPVRFWATFPI